MLNVELALIRHNDGMFDGSAEFSDVAGPVVADETGHCVLGEGFLRPVIFFGKFAEK